MKKILLSLVTVLASMSMNAQDVVNMYVEVGSTDDVKNIPVTLYMDNAVDIIGFQASFALPEGLTKDNYTTDFVFSSRATDNHVKNSKSLYTKSAPNDLLVSCVTDNSSTLGESTGAVGTFSFDGSGMADGEYTVTLYGASAFPDAKGRYDAAGYHTTAQGADYKPFSSTAKFTVANGSVTGINSVKTGTNAASMGIFNIAGQRLNGLQKGINIVDGKKVIVK